MANILVTGGAGYVGSHICKALKAAGHIPVTFDNISTGWRDAVRFGPLEEGDLRDIDRVEEVMRLHKPDAVLHIAALSDIAKSMLRPEEYHEVNVVGTGNLLKAMERYHVAKIIFSSTCAVYQAGSAELLTEEAELAPNSVYGRTKLDAENAISIAGTTGIRSVKLRYFNVAGADSEAEIGEFHRPETHLIPIAIHAAVEGKVVAVNGDDYATPDGTCIRDYIHVEDLAQAHLFALRWLIEGGLSETFNLGTGHGYSVLEILRMVEETTGTTISTSIGPRRAGDNAKLVSASTKAARLLGWSVQKSDLRQMIGDAWAWHRGTGYLR